jgi:hypothetical protein
LGADTAAVAALKTIATAKVSFDFEDMLLSPQAEVLVGANDLPSRAFSL